MTVWTSTAVTGTALLVAGVLTTAVHPHQAAAHPRSASAAHVATTTPAGSEFDREIARVQQHLADVPVDAGAWATLGFDYVQQAKLTVDPAYYPKAARALRRSLRLQTHDNFVAMAGEASLHAALHDFRSALGWARRGLAVDPRSAPLLGALGDALTQLGRYSAAQHAAIRMEAVSPGTPAEARLSYSAELRGDLPAAVRLMQRALDDAASSSDVAFTRYYLGQLALSAGRPGQALREFRLGLAAVPSDAASLEGKARAEAALGRSRAALRDFATVVTRVPQPGYVLEYGALLSRVGDSAAAAQQWSLFRTEEQLFRANGVTLDSDAVLFEADHGSPAAAVRAGRRALRTRPFLDTYDAYAWALHRAGRNAAALVASNTALATGMHNPLFLRHRAQIERSLGLHSAMHRDLTAAGRRA
jgi:tetratricopeptide (TPR) repeat protein